MSLINDIQKAILNNLPIEDKLHVIMVISNPCNYAIRYKLAKEFIQHMEDNNNVILYVVELVYGNQQYNITDSNNKRHLQLQTDQIPIWHKENMINLGVKKLLPNTWKAFAWIDADLEFDNPNWALDTLKILNGTKDIVQLFTNVFFLDDHGDTEILFTSFGYQYVKKTKRAYTGYEISFWHPGFAWACTRELYEKMGGLYEYAITGDGDYYMENAMLGDYNSVFSEEASDDFRKSLQIYENKVVGAKIGYVPGVLRHNYHGSVENRNYAMRAKILTSHNYSPSLHLTKDNNGLLIPTDDFPSDLKNTILNHFKSKKEDIIINTINIKNALELKLKKSLTTNCILINLKKDTDRLESSKKELEKLCINNDSITYLDATYWKDMNRLESDLNTVFTFLKQFNNNIPDKVTINEFLETDDPNINIQSGPLACYCSHLRAMMHGYLNFKDYTIICEDDISIDNIDNIKKYIDLIPIDWDIICGNGVPKNVIYSGDYYKFTDIFYHLHFYIIKNKCMKTIFQNVYPIVDQIDILIGNMHDKLNIYNITNTVTQKQFITNIQNNLHIIYNTPIYSKLATELNLLKDICYSYVNDKLKNNIEQINKNISNKIIEDVIYVNIFNYLDNNYNKNNNSNQVDASKLFIQIQKILLYYIKDPNYVNVNSNRFNNKDTVDPITPEENVITCNFASRLMNDINYILNSFTLHNTNSLKAYGFGSTSSIYLLKENNTVIKVYNDKLRWSCKDHDNLNNIYNKELMIMEKLTQLITYDNKTLSITMKYLGESLYYMFGLPDNWEKQICDIFTNLTNNNIYYPEFNLNNIVVQDNVISFIDYGLAEINNVDNTNNCAVFIKLLNILNEKYKIVQDQTQRHILYNTFMNNLRSNNMYSSNIF